MDTNQRLQYLQAMGITCWQARDAFGQQPSSQSALQENTPTLSTLSDCVSQCMKCDLHKTRTQTVFGVGSSTASLLIVGEAPGAEEDRLGEPFVGRAGKLLDQMLKAIGLNRETIYIANILKCRPPRNRNPDAEEISQCTPYLQQQIALIQPRVILALGRVAAHHLLDTNQSLRNMRQQRFDYQGTPLMVSYHPAYLLRTPSDKVKAFEDLRRLQQWLANDGTDAGKLSTL